MHCAVLELWEAARRIARLTLGVSTKNVHVSHDPYAQISDHELAADLTQLGISPSESAMQ